MATTQLVRQRPVDCVADFHAKNDQVINGKLSRPDAKTVLLRLRLMNEELGETSIALHKGDWVEAADGLADFLYVVLGTAVACGADVETRFADPAAPWDADSPDFISFCLSQLMKYTATVEEEMADPKASPYMIKYKLEILVNQITGVAARLGVPLEEVFYEVHRSNMTKQLGGAKDGAKYGPQDPKGQGYEPPKIKEVLEAHGWCL